MIQGLLVGPFLAGMVALAICIGIRLHSWMMRRWVAPHMCALCSFLVAHPTHAIRCMNQDLEIDECPHAEQWKEAVAAEDECGCEGLPTLQQITGGLYGLAITHGVERTAAGDLITRAMSDLMFALSKAPRAPTAPTAAPEAAP